MISLNIYANAASVECRYCGNEHDPKELCRAGRVNRRAFIFTASAAAVGAMLPAPVDAAEIWKLGLFVVKGEQGLGGAVSHEAWRFDDDSRIWLAV